MNGVPDQLRAQLELLKGEPELVTVDARVLRLLMGPLANLVILQAHPGPTMLPDGDDPYVWDDDPLC